jgi:hypothetical protein
VTLGLDACGHENVAKLFQAQSLEKIVGEIEVELWDGAQLRDASGAVQIIDLGDDSFDRLIQLHRGRSDCVLARDDHASTSRRFPKVFSAGTRPELASSGAEQDEELLSEFGCAMGEALGLGGSGAQVPPPSRGQGRGRSG